MDTVIASDAGCIDDEREQLAEVVRAVIDRCHVDGVDPAREIVDAVLGLPAAVVPDPVIPAVVADVLNRWSTKDPIAQMVVAEVRGAFVRANLGGPVGPDSPDLRERLLALIPLPHVSERVSNWPEDEQHYLRHGDWNDFTELDEVLDRMRRERCADAVLAAVGQGATAEVRSDPDALDALPVGSVVLGDDGRPWQRRHSGWETVARFVAFPPTAAGLTPARVLYRADAEQRCQRG